MMVTETDLDDLFAEAATVRAQPAAGLITRILADADQLQPKPAPLQTAPQPRGWFHTVADWFGGGMSLAGMSAAALTGLYLGVAQPVPVATLTEFVTGSTTLDSLDLLPSTGTLWEQE